MRALVAFLSICIVGNADAQQQPKNDDERLAYWTELAQEWIQESCTITATSAKGADAALCVNGVRDLRLFTSYQLCNAKNKSYVARTQCQYEAALAVERKKDEYIAQRLNVAVRFDRGQISAARVEAEFSKLVPLTSAKDPEEPELKEIRRFESWAQTAPRGVIPGLAPGILASFEMRVADRQSSASRQAKPLPAEGDLSADFRDRFEAYSIARSREPDVKCR
jgi:hypothetical protein